MKQPYRILAAAPCLLALSAAPGGAAHAAAFQLQEQSASLLGSAFAGRTADARDISHIFFNPATLGRHIGHGVEAELIPSYIDPTFDFRADSDTIPSEAPVHFDGRERAGGGEGALVPVLYAGFDLTPDLRAGIGINVPYGMETDYPEDWVGRYDAVNTDLMTIDINPAIGWRVDDRLSLGAGLSAQYADAELSTMLPSLADNDPTTTLQPEGDGKLTVSGDSWAYSFNLGAHFALNDRTQLGIAYRHGLSHTLSGDAEITARTLFDDDDDTPPFISLDAQETGGEAKLNIPATLSLGLTHQLATQWTLLADATWTQWSDFEDLTIEFDDAVPIDPADPTTRVSDTYDWDDAWFLSVGTLFDFNDAWDFRLGLAYDQTPTSDEYRTPRIPDEDRTWLAIGGTWTSPTTDQLTVHFGYTYIWLDDANITLAREIAEAGGFETIEGEYNSNVQIFSASANWYF
ncbi:hypothetical protein CKO15_05575 [Halorhodospira abdelmalekii]|uniref:OmpP1/FadL family transporter n=1 Tax=Halorhodospira abdelmalekii TaxID=421629 RepID=UPI0019053052|nr:outer membrane protein transport protein [Halorhodospira abdelmalekii]MBK1734766.1 hypothetical protein [Halorhodospira abdelmalekii]